MTLNRDGERLLSDPIELYFCGWKSDTYTLQDNGWEISVKEDFQCRRMALALRHKASGLRGLSDTLDWDFYRFRMSRDPRYSKNGVRERYPIFNCRLASDIIIQHKDIGPDIVEFNPIDARPMFASSVINSLDDLSHFRKIEVPGNEIFLKNASMQEIMEMALSRQEPAQERIRKQMVRDEELQVMRNSKLKANLRLVS